MDAAALRSDTEPDDEPYPSREWDRAPVLPALGLVLLGVVWLAFLVWPRPPAADSADVGFLRDMIVHHNQAVQMAQIAHDGTTDPDISILSIDIAGSQQLQVGTMFGWLEQWGRSPNHDGPAMAWMGAPVEGLMPGMATAEELQHLQTLTGAELDAEFLRLMTRHHLSGADMATACVELCDDAEVVRLARNIATVQAGEIDLMNEMLVERGQPPVTAGDHAMSGMDIGAASMGGMVGPTTAETLRSVLVKAIRALPVIFGLVALVGLIVDSLARRLGRDDDQALPLTALLAGMAGATVSAALHAGLVPGFLDIRTDLGLFQAGVVLVQSSIVAAAIAGRRRSAALRGAVGGLAVIAAWALLKLAAPADDDDGRYDLPITLAMTAEAIQAAAFFWAWRRSAAPADDGEPVASGI